MWFRCLEDRRFLLHLVSKLNLRGLHSKPVTAAGRFTEQSPIFCFVFDARYISLDPIIGVAEDGKFAFFCDNDGAESVDDLIVIVNGTKATST